MKTRLVIGIGLMIFGIANFFQYLPISHSPTFWNKPFPFEHLEKVIPSESSGTTIQIGYLPFENAINDPYWLFWSLALYSGIFMTCFEIWSKRK